jgi:hypothetical protein
MDEIEQMWFCREVSKGSSMFSSELRLEFRQFQVLTDRRYFEDCLYHLESFVKISSFDLRFDDRSIMEILKVNGILLMKLSIF